MRPGKKIAALNLVLIMVVGLIFCAPVAYAEGDQYEDVEYTPAVGIGVDSTQEDNEIPNAESLNASLMDAEPYWIRVNGTSFLSDEDASGTGWSYNRSYGTLSLTDYTGSLITSSGDLTIYTNGTVNVSGSSGSYGSNAVTVGGTLNLFIFSGNSTFTGGTGVVNGGYGISATALNVFSLSSSSNLICTGGYGETYGGYGIYGYDIYIDPDYAVISGGNSPVNPGYGIVYRNSLEISLCYMTVQAGSTSGYAFATDSGNPFYYSSYSDMTLTGNYRYDFSPKIFTLTLDGNGGTFNGLGNVSLQGSYPTYTDLSDYVFSRDDYQHVGWVGWTTDTSLSSFQPLSTTYLPTTSTTLYAWWAAVQSNTVTFIGNAGTISGDYYTQTTTGDAVDIPSSSVTIASNLYLLGWSDELKQTSISNYIVNEDSAWYAPGSSAKVDTPTTLYAQWVSQNSSILYYYGNGGVSSSGGNMSVQRTAASGSSLSLYIQDDMGFTKNGYSFNGWADAFGTPYALGTEVPTPTSGLKITELYAQWTPMDTYTGGNSQGDEMTCYVKPELGTIDATFDVTSVTSGTSENMNIIAAIYEGNQLARVKLQTFTLTGAGVSGTLSFSYPSSVQPESCKLFILNHGNSVPRCPVLTCWLN